jgi:hypothetical protein
MRADEVEAGERVRHAITGEIVTVTGRRDMLTRTKVKFRAKGQHGWFTVPPHYELEEM